MAAPSQEPRRERTPPHSLDAEISVLGSALLSPNAVEVLVAELQPEDFYRQQHRHIAAAIRRLHARDTPIDVVTVSEDLRTAGSLEDVGGIEGIAQLYTDVPAVSRAGHYAQIVSRNATLRRLLWRSAEIQDLVYDNPDDIGQTLRRAQDLIGSIEGGSLEHSTLDIADIATLLEGDLVPEEAVLLTRTDGACLLYAGKMHSFQAEPSSGKTWFGLEACREALELGGAAVFFDYEDTAVGVLSRMMALGSNAEDVTKRFRYVQPNGGIGGAEKDRIAKILDELNPDVVVIDGVANALTKGGFSEDKASDVVRWMDDFPRWIARQGPAVVMIDHVAKDPEARGRWARGSSAKLGEIDGVAYQLKVLKPFSRDTAGSVKLVIAKDRPGGVGPIGHTAAIVTIDPHGHGQRVVVNFDPDTSTISTEDGWKPTAIMEKVSRLIETSTVPLSPSGVRAVIGSKKDLVSQAIQRLIIEGHLIERGTRSKTLEFVKPYHDPQRPEPEPQKREIPPDYTEPIRFDDHDYWDSLEADIPDP